MRHTHNLSELQLVQPSLVTIGVFDGVHRGHQTLLKQLVHEAHDSGKQAVVMTFHPHPDTVLRDIQGRYYLTSPKQRAEFLGEIGIDVVVTYPFDDDVREIRAADFVDKLVNHLNMQGLWVGSDFALGYQREGNVTYLTELGIEKGYTVRPIELVTQNQDATIINSTAIRDALKNGDVQTANNLLGRAYAVSGTVVEGDKRGRTIGFPTANMSVWEQQILPANGVYAGWVQLDTERFMAVANIGIRPTFDGTIVTVEPHILDFDRDIYGETLTLSFEKRLRGEKKFNGIDDLKAQLQHDIITGRAYLESQA